MKPPEFPGVFLSDEPRKVVLHLRTNHILRKPYLLPERLTLISITHNMKV
jgi:hypothetical protein